MKTISTRLFMVALLAIFSNCSQAQVFFRIDGIYRLNFHRPAVYENSPVAHIDVSYFRQPDSPTVYCNLFIRPTFSSPEYWVFRNLAIEPFNDTVKLSVEVDLNEHFPPDSFPPFYLCGYAYTQLPLNNMPGSGITYNPNTVGTREITFGNQLPDLASTGKITGRGNPKAPPYVFDGDSTRTVLVGCNMPNMDLNDSIYNSLDQPDYAGDDQACAPVATTNSFTWLRAQHPEIDTILKAKFGTGDTAMRNMLKEFSKLMGRDTSSLARVTIRDFIRGKLAFIDKYRLPIHVKYQSISDNLIDSTRIYAPDGYLGHSATNRNAAPDTGKPYARITPDWMYNEMKNGEDVEMFLIWLKKDSSGNWVPENGHYVTLTGVHQRGGVTRLRIKDDGDQARPGGTREKPVTMAEDTALRGASYIPELSNDSMGRCYIKDVVSESYDNTITFPTSGLDDAQNESWIVMMQPNPVKNYCHITVHGIYKSPVTLSVYDLQGRAMHKQTLGDEQGYYLNTSAWPAGLYCVKLITAKNEWTGKLVVGPK